MDDRKEREDRLAAALRENLKRRKAQRRERGEETGGGGADRTASAPDVGEGEGESGPNEDR